MARRKRKHTCGPVVRMPWHDDAYPHDFGRGRKNGGGRSPRPGARTGPVRSGRR